MILSIIGLFLYVLFQTSTHIVPQSETVGDLTQSVAQKPENRDIVGPKSDPAQCDEGQVHCLEDGKCIKATQPCEGRCLSKNYTVFWAEKNKCIEWMKCAYNEWQCEGECISQYSKCNGTCKDFFWDCEQKYGRECLHDVDICDGKEHCLDGSDERDCPEDCVMPASEKLRHYGHGNSNRVVGCMGEKICAEEPCNAKCLLAKYEWFCEGSCIDKREPCKGTCQAEEGLQCRQYHSPPYPPWCFNSYPVLCEDELKCVNEIEQCGHKCLNPDLPILAPWGRGPFGNGGRCIAEDQCTTSGPILEQAKYMCNGLCIPVIIPCNNTCLDLGAYETLFGPVTCYGSIWSYPDSRDFWTKSLPPDILSEVRNIIGHTDSSLGLCLPGSIGCNGTCILDPKRPYVSKGRRSGEIECHNW